MGKQGEKGVVRDRKVGGKLDGFKFTHEMRALSKFSSAQK